MIVLADTSTALMVIRIAPDMLVDAKYECAITKEVHEEVYRTQKFKDKYPWRTKFKSKMKSLPQSKSNCEAAKERKGVIDALHKAGTVNANTGKFFDLSFRDRAILSCALANGYQISSGDEDLKDFGRQQFPKEFKGTVSPLGLVNGWLRSGLVKWDEQKQAIVKQWRGQKEASQPRSAIKQFKKLTKAKYPGP